jgi:hypothetical protein
MQILTSRRSLVIWSPRPPHPADTNLPEWEKLHQVLNSAAKTQRMLGKNLLDRDSENSTEHTGMTITIVMKDGASCSSQMFARSIVFLAFVSFSVFCTHESAAGELPGIRILNLRKLTNCPLSDTVPVSFEAHNDVGTLRYAMLQVDGHIFPGGDGMLSASVFSPPLKSRSHFEMDTCYLENGPHNLKIETGWSNFSPTNMDDQIFRRESTLISITVSNEIYYPEWESEIGERFGAYFFKTTRTNVDWHIDIYDMKKKFVRRLSGHTQDGKIEARWDLRDSKGVLRTNAEVDTEFSSVITIDGSPGKGKIIRK